MEEPIDLKRIREKLIQNNLPPSLIDNFKALHKAQEERAREAELIEEEETRRIRDQGQDNSNEKRSKSSSNINNSQPSAKRRSTTKSKRSRVAFGSRISGLLRSRYETETVGRTYFDDEDKSNSENIRIGKKAEDIIYQLILTKLKPDQHKHLGDTNIGFDIQYGLEGTEYFVEVKGLVGDWNDNDALLSRAQFEKAQKRGISFQFLWLSMLITIKSVKFGKYGTLQVLLERCKWTTAGEVLRSLITSLNPRKECFCSTMDKK